MATVLAVLPGPRRSCKHHWPFLWAPRKPELELERVSSCKRPGFLACAAFGTVWTRPLGGKETCRDAAQSTACCRNTRAVTPQRQHNAWVGQVLQHGLLCEGHYFIFSSLHFPQVSSAHCSIHTSASTHSHVRSSLDYHFKVDMAT